MKPELTIVIPVYNEAENLIPLHRRLTGVLQSLQRSYELIFVDDGSTDGSDAVLEDLEKQDPDHVRRIHFITNYGKTAALTAAFRVARGRFVFTMDADLQDDPAEIPRFLEKLEAGVHLVSGWRKKRLDPPGKTIPSRVFNFVVRTLTGVPLHDFNCGFKGYRREVLEHLRLYGEYHRFIPVLAAWKGFRVDEVVVTHHPRHAGRSKFGWKRMIHGYIDFLSIYFLTRFLQRPMHLFGGIGTLFFLSGVGISAYLSYEKLVRGMGLSNRPLLLLGVLLILSGLQLLITGFLGEMLRYHHHRPGDQFVIREMSASRERSQEKG